MVAAASAAVPFAGGAATGLAAARLAATGLAGGGDDASLAGGWPAAAMARPNPPAGIAANTGPITMIPTTAAGRRILDGAKGRIKRLLESMEIFRNCQLILP